MHRELAEGYNLLLYDPWQGVGLGGLSGPLQLRPLCDSKVTPPVRLSLPEGAFLILLGLPNNRGQTKLWE